MPSGLSFCSVWAQTRRHASNALSD